METISIIPKKGGEKKFFNPKSTSLRSIIKAINERGLSLEEAEEMAKIDKGKILSALEKNDMLKPMDQYYLVKTFC